MEIVGEAIFSIAQDDSGLMYRSAVASHAGQLWLVATWLQPLGQGRPIPGWLVPLHALGLRHPEPADQTWVGSALPKELAGPQQSIAAMQRAGAVLNPQVLATQASSKARPH